MHCCLAQPSSSPTSKFSNKGKKPEGRKRGAGREKSFQGALLALLTPRGLSQGIQRINYSTRYTTTTSLETM